MKVTRSFLFILLFSFSLALPAKGQRGDRRGESQPPLTGIQIPPAPVLPPDAALTTFTLPPHFKIQLVAAEPLVENPVALQFGPDGRLWVVEMRGYMPNLEGRGEDQPVGRVVVLEDKDGDGKMDSSKIFLDHLVLPRALCLVRDGLLVGEPPKLWFCRDTDHDGQADEKIEVAADYGSYANPEHTANGLLWGRDNWIYSANYSGRFRNVDGRWERSPTISRGQWGLSQDDFGRLFHNSNADQLRADLVPAEYLVRNPNYRAAGANVQIAKDQNVWPGRVNPGVNRGYQKWQLRDGRLATFTAACAPLVYRGNNFPAEFYGNVFVCEPAGNLVRRNVIHEEHGVLTAENAYQQKEFLTSTDERFRPVNLCNGPDGALYLADMYHGILQHHLYVTTFLRQQILDRHLDAPNNLGRIYRVVSDVGPRNSPPQLERLSTVELVKILSHPNGWHRDTAQRLLVERRDASAVPPLRNFAAAEQNPIARLYALWTLDGMGRLDRATLEASLRAKEPKVRSAAVRLAEPFFKASASSALLRQAITMASTEADAEVIRQLALSLGEIHEPEAGSALGFLLKKYAADLYTREAVLSGIGGRELEFLQELWRDSGWRIESSGRTPVLSALANAILKERIPERINQLLELTAAEPPTSWRYSALVDGMIAALPVTERRQARVPFKKVKLAAEPALLANASAISNTVIRAKLEKINGAFGWPGKPGGSSEPAVKPLTAEEQARFEQGKELYTITCGACHQPHGRGQEGLAPPLLESEWVLGPSSRVIRIALHGVRGPIKVQGKLFELEMPPMGVLSDEQLAQVLTYVRRAWDNSGDPISPAEVAKIRAETSSREEAWTAPDLLKVK